MEAGMEVGSDSRILEVDEEAKTLIIEVGRGKFRARITFPPKYPFCPPECDSPHPLACLKPADWVPSVRLKDVLQQS